MNLWPLYRAATLIAAPFLPLYLRRRGKRGKEDFIRMPERFGIPSRARPKAPLLWVHAASIGETASVLPMLSRILAERPEWHALVTSGTITSGALCAAQLPRMAEGGRAFHQFIPIDAPRAVRRFMLYWRPDAALWLESEFWPNLLLEARGHGLYPHLINARLSDHSFRGWRKVKRSALALLASFKTLNAQSEADANRLRLLSGRDVTMPGNLKYDAPPLAHDPEALAAFQSSIGKRLVWIAASTHPGEEMMLARVHANLRHHFKDALLILVPRHAARGGEIAAELESHGHPTARRSLQEDASIASIYLADTMGELGLFYRLDAPVFVGGSLVPHGGQNILEPARLGRAVLTGPHTQNFHAIIDAMKNADAVSVVRDEATLADALLPLLSSETLREEAGAKAQRFTAAQGGAIDRLMEILLPALDEVTRADA